MTNNEMSRNAVDFIDDARIQGLLQTAPDRARVREVIAKSLEKRALTLEETAALLVADDLELVEEMFEAARELKRRIYGNRIVLFAPLYIGNKCINDCRYCGFRRSNTSQIRRTLTPEELRSEVEALENSGHKRLILVFGEHPAYGAEYIAECARQVYSVKVGRGAIRRVNINAAPLDVEGYRVVKSAGIGTYQIFQETYNKEAYKKYHPQGTRKGDYLWRLDGLSRAQEGGIDDVGIGALVGLHDWRFEVMGLVSHARFLQERYGVGPHTISFPRIQPASGLSMDELSLVSDHDFMRLVAILRLAVPYTGMILTARENPELRNKVLAFGVSQIDAGSRLEIGGYTEELHSETQVKDKEQFVLGDIRSLDSVTRNLAENGYIPSFCTACYRLGRTGEKFMEYAIPGFIQNCCTPNAMTTLQEYLTDYATPETRAAGQALIEAELAKMPEGPQKRQLAERLQTIRQTDQRDLFV